MHLAEGGEQLNRECSLFSECGRFVLVGSAAYLPDEPHPPMQVFFGFFYAKRQLAAKALAAMAIEANSKGHMLC